MSISQVGTFARLFPRRARIGLAAVWVAVGARCLPAAQTEPTTDSQAPPAARADLQAARQLVRDGKLDEADHLLAELQSTYPDDPSLLLLRGEVFNATKHPDQAIALLRHAAEIAPQKPRVHFELATSLSALGDVAGALEAFAKEVERNQDPKVQVLSRLNRSILFQKDRKWNEAAAELEQVLEIEPERKEAYGDLAELYLDAGRPEDAVRTAERGQAAGFQSARLHHRTGVAFFNQKAYDKAVEAFQKAIEIQPDLAAAELSLAKSLDQLGRKDEARAHLKRYLELRPDAPEAAEIRKRLKLPAKNPTPKRG